MMKMRKALMALTLALVMCVTGITMTGCGKIDYIGFDSYEGDSEGEMMGSDVTVKQFLEANPDAIWFYTPELDKDLKLNTEFYRFENGKAYVYYYDDEIRLSEVADLTIEQLEESTMRHWENEIADRTPEIGDSFEENVDAWKKFTNNLDIKRDITSPKPYSLSIFTDESGNYVAKEVIRIPEVSIKTKGHTIDGYDIKMIDEVYLKNYSSSHEVVGGGYMGDIYDTHYGGFSLEHGSMLITKIENPETYIVLDELGTEGITVDPK